nr:hypothetical protein [uncultured Pseudomonas sp.]
MPYAAEGRISQDQFAGALEISQAQFLEGLEGMQKGLHVQIIDGEFFVGPLPEPDPDPEPEPTYREAAAELNAAYQVDVSAFRDAFTGAALAGGPTQAAKQEALAERFNARKAKYIADSAALRAQYGA